MDVVAPQPTHLCSNARCAPLDERGWHLEALGHEYWRLSCRRGVFTVAASEPLCPLCAAPLLEIAPLEPGQGPPAALDPADPWPVPWGAPSLRPT